MQLEARVIVSYVHLCVCSVVVTAIHVLVHVERCFMLIVTSALVKLLFICVSYDMPKKLLLTILCYKTRTKEQYAYTCAV